MGWLLFGGHDVWVLVVTLIVFLVMTMIVVVVRAVVLL